MNTRKGTVATESCKALIHGEPVEYFCDLPAGHAGPHVCDCPGERYSEDRDDEHSSHDGTLRLMWPVGEGGYDVVGHNLLEYWEAKAAAEADNRTLQQAVRDIRLLVDLQDIEISWKNRLLEELAKSKREEQERRT